MVKCKLNIPEEATYALPISESASMAVSLGGSNNISLSGPGRVVHAYVNLSDYWHTGHKFRLKAEARLYGAMVSSSGSADVSVSALAIIQPEEDEQLGDECIVYATCSGIGSRSNTSERTLINNIPDNQKFTAKIGDTITVSIDLHSHLIDSADPDNYFAGSQWLVYIDIYQPAPPRLEADYILPTTNGDYTIAYSVIGHLSRATTAKVFWSKDTTYTSRVSDVPIFSQSIAAGDRGGHGFCYKATIPRSSLAIPPDGANYAVLVIDDLNTSRETNESDNFASTEVRRLSTLDIDKFISGYKAAIGPLSSGQEGALRQLLTRILADPNINSAHDVRQAAYILATVRRETGSTYLPVEE